MIKNKKILSLFLFVASGLVLVAFQNCAPAAFKSLEGVDLASNTGLNDPNVGSGGDDGSGNGAGNGDGNSNGSGNGGSNPGGDIGNGGGSYSEKCDDYAAKGWSSKEECLKDGGWHLVVEVPAGGGTPTTGSVDDLYRHIEAGTDVKVIIPEQRLYSNGAALSIVMSGNEECQQVYRSQKGSRPIYCLTSARFAGETLGEVAHGSARYGTDGSIFCASTSRVGGNGCTVDPLRYKWYIRY